MSLNHRGAALEELLEVTNFRKKVQDIIVGNWKKEKVFQKLLEKICQSSWCNHSRQKQSSRGNVYEKTDEELGISGNAGTIPK